MNRERLAQIRRDAEMGSEFNAGLVLELLDEIQRLKDEADDQYWDRVEADELRNMSDSDND